MTQDTPLDTTSDVAAGPDIDARATLGFLGVYLAVAFVLMTAVSLVTDSLAVRGVAFLICHAAGAVAGYRLVVAPQIAARGIKGFSAQVEKLGANFGLFAVLKHVLLLILGRAAAWLAGADQVLVWIVDTTFLNTSLLPDVAALGVISIAVYTAERARGGHAIQRA